MAARVRRERKRDKVEEELHNRQLALQHTGGVITTAIVPAVELEICIEVEPGGWPSSWVLHTRLVGINESVVFEVLPGELENIPYPPGTFMRLVPYTNMHILQPSRWFKSGMDPCSNFNVGYAAGDGPFTYIRLTLPDEVFAGLVADLVMGRLMGGGESFQLVMLGGEFA